MSKKILIIEDEANIANLVKYNLEKNGYRCFVKHNGEDALKHINNNAVDLILLDIMLPGMDGLEVCKAVKQDKKKARIPVVMLTAKGEEVDRIVGFELGADDYIVKPFSPRELVLRVKAILKRGEQPVEEQDLIVSGKITMDIPRHLVTVAKKNVEMTPMEFNLLLTLIQRRGRVQSRERLLNDVWDISSDVSTRTVDTHIKRLREKLGPCGKSIRTVRGLGYKFEEK
jgi:DNA-binding response OmpR family regulator